MVWTVLGLTPDPGMMIMGGDNATDSSDMAFNMFKLSGAEGPLCPLGKI